MKQLLYIIYIMKTRDPWMEGKYTGKEKEKKKVINRYVVSNSFAKLELDLGTVGKALGAKKTTPDLVPNTCFHSSFASQLPSL